MIRTLVEERPKISERWWALILLGLLAYILLPTFLNERLEVVALRYADGRFIQLVIPERSDMLRGKWTASIADVETGEIVCAGDVEAKYTQRDFPVIMTPDVWTDADCSRLVVGREYVGSASWKSEDGLISFAQVQFVHEEPSE